MSKELELLTDQVCAVYGDDPVMLLPILQEIQQRSEGNYISDDAARIIARKLNITESRVYDVVTYFSALSAVPRGDVIVQICNSTTCSICDNRELVTWFEDELGVKVGETTPDNKFTLIYTHCIGACDIAPAVRINHDVYGGLTREKVRELVASYRAKEAVK